MKRLKLIERYIDGEKITARNIGEEVVLELQANIENILTYDYTEEDWYEDW